MSIFTQNHNMTKNYSFGYLILFLFLPFVGRGQEGVIYYGEGKGSVRSSIYNVSDRFVHTPDRSYPLYRVISISFDQWDEDFHSLYLEAAKTRKVIYFHNVSTETSLPDPELQNMEEQFTQYRRFRTHCKVAQLAAGVLYLASLSGENTRTSEIALRGSAWSLLAVGLSLDLMSGRILNVKFNQFKSAKKP